MKLLRKRTVTFGEGVNVLGFGDNSSNSAQESSLIKNLMTLVMIFQRMNCAQVRK